MGIENPVHILFVAVVALIVLGPRRLPELARAVGKGVREFREAVSGEAPAPEPPLGAQPAVTAEPVGPVQPVPSGDAPDRGSL